MSLWRQNHPVSTTFILNEYKSIRILETVISEEISEERNTLRLVLMSRVVSGDRADLASMLWAQNV